MAKKNVEEKINLDAILFKCRDILRKARNSGSFFEKRDMMLTLVFLRFIGEKFEDGVENLRQNLIKEGLDPDDEAIKAAFLDDPTFTDGTYNLPVDARWSTIIQTPAPKLNVALDTALHISSISDLENSLIDFGKIYASAVNLLALETSSTASAFLKSTSSCGLCSIR